MTTIYGTVKKMTDEEYYAGTPTEKNRGEFYCVCNDPAPLKIEFKYCPFCGIELNWLMSQIMREEYR